MKSENKDLSPAVRYWLIFVIGWVFLIVALGGITRLEGAGLSIVDWRPVTGVLPPWGSEQWDQEFLKYQDSPDFRSRVQMSLTDFKYIYWWEYSHRLVARMLGLVLLLPFLIFWRRGWLRHGDGVRLVVLLGLVGVQGGLGWFMVKSGLVQNPQVSHLRLMVHFLWACLILAFLASWLQRQTPGRRLPKCQRNYLRILSYLVIVQLALGALVAGSRAGYIFNTFPKMGEQWGPEKFFVFDGWVENLFYNQINLQFFHRIGAWVLAVLVVAGWRWGNKSIALLLLLQFVLGVFTLVLKVPVPVAVLHQILGAFIFFRIWCLLAANNEDFALEQAKK